MTEEEHVIKSGMTAANEAFESTLQLTASPADQNEATNMAAKLKSH